MAEARAPLGRLAGAMLRTGGAAATAQLIVLGTMPIASRLFDETAFGVLGLMVALANILVITTHLGFIDTLIAADSDADADDLLRLILGICAAGSLINLALVLGAISFDVLGYGKLPLWATGFVVAQAAIISLGFAFQQRLVRAQNYGALAGSHLALGLGRGVGQVGLGLTLPTAFGLLSAELFSRCATLAYAVRATPRDIWRFAGRRGAMAALARRFAGFAAWRAAGIFLNAVNLAMPTMIIARHFSLEDVGILSFALTLIYAPIGLIQKAIGDIFTGTYRAALEAGGAAPWQVFTKMAALLTGIALIFGIVASLWAEPLFAWIFGAGWAASGRTVELLAPMIALMVLVVPLSASLNILKRPDVAVAFNLGRLAGLGALLAFAGAWGMSYEASIQGICAIGVLAYVIYGGAIAVLNHRRTKGAGAS